MAKCISLSNYNLSSTNVLIIGAGIGWHVLGPPCVSSPRWVCGEQGVCHPSCVPHVQRVRPEGLPQPFCPLHTNGPKVLCASGLWSFVVTRHSPL